MTNKAKLIATGIYAPGEAISNLELKELAHIEFDHQKLEKKLGIKERHIAKLRGIKESSADFAFFALKNAIKNANISDDQLDLIIVASDTPEFISPSTALVVQGRLDNKEKFARAFDINASCASFTTALDTAARLLASDQTINYAAVIGVYNMPAYIRDGDAFGYSIFADGAGAVILSKTTSDDKSQYIDGVGLVDGSQWDFIGVYSGGTNRPVSQKDLDNKTFGLESLKPLPGDRNIRLWPIMIEKLLEKSQIKKEQINHYLFTQINRFVIEEVMKGINVDIAQTTCIMDRYAYTGSACIPMALHHGLIEGKIKKGDTILQVASGAGLSVFANIFTL